MIAEIKGRLGDLLKQALYRCLGYALAAQECLKGAVSRANVDR